MYYIIFFIIVFLAAYFLTKTAREEEKKKLDEEQLRAQMKAYQYGFFAMILFLVVYAVAGSAVDLSWFTPEAVAVTGIAAGVAVMAGYGIGKGVYFNNDNKSGKNLCWLFGVVGVMNLWLATTRILDGEMIVDGKLAGSYLNLVIGILFFVIFVAAGTKELKRKL